MDRDLVIGLDSSTTSAKAIAWTRDGAAVAEGRSPLGLRSPAPNWYEQDPEEWWTAACQALRGLLTQVAAERVAALAISNQRETFAALDADGNAVRPAIVWLDQRCQEEVAWLSGRVGGERIHELSGKPVDMAPVAYRLAWMLRHEPAEYARTAMFTDVHGYLAQRLCGRFQTSWASADPLGLFDLQRKEWAAEILAALELQPGRLPATARPGTVLGEVNTAAAAGTGLRAGTPIVAGGGDGQAAGLGVNALRSGRGYLNLGTAVVGGIYCREYRTGQAWRTMGSCSGTGYYCETSLRSGTFLLDWFLRQCAGGESRQSLEDAAARLPVGSAGLLALPYWGAVMTPYWDQDARGAWVGLGGGHGTAHLYRALLEGIALEQALVAGMIEEETGIRVEEWVAMGGGSASGLWCQILADACGRPVARCETAEASSLGAGMCAAVGAGWFASPEDAAEAMQGRLTRVSEPAQAERYRELLGIYRELYPQLRRTFQRLARFAGQG